MSGKATETGSPSWIPPAWAGATMVARRAPAIASTPVRRRAYRCCIARSPADDGSGGHKRHLPFDIAYAAYVAGFRLLRISPGEAANRWALTVQEQVRACR